MNWMKIARLTPAEREELADDFNVKHKELMRKYKDEYPEDRRQFKSVPKSNGRSAHRMGNDQ